MPSILQTAIAEFAAYLKADGHSYATVAFADEYMSSAASRSWGALTYEQQQKYLTLAAEMLARGKHA